MPQTKQTNVERNTQTNKHMNTTHKQIHLTSSSSRSNPIYMYKLHHTFTSTIQSNTTRVFMYFTFSVCASQFVLTYKKDEPQRKTQHRTYKTCLNIAINIEEWSHLPPPTCKSTHLFSYIDNHVLLKVDWQLDSDLTEKNMTETC